MSPNHQAAEDLLRELQTQRLVVEQLRQEAEAALSQARKQQAEMEARLASIEETRLELVEEARQELQDRISGLLGQLQQAERSLLQAREEENSRNTLAQARREPPERPLSGLRAELDRGQTPTQFTQMAADRGAAHTLAGAAAQWRPGVHSWHPPSRGGNNAPGRSGTGGSAAGHHAGQDSRVPVGAPGGGGPLRRRGKGCSCNARRGVPARLGGQMVGWAGSTMEINLHGHRVEEALEKVEDLLNEASVQGVEKVRIIHGRGTGALRRAIREYLGNHPLVASANPDPGPLR